MPAPANGACNAANIHFSFPAVTRQDARPPGGTAAHNEQKHRFDELCQPHLKKVFQITFRITRNREDAEDAMQDGLLQAYLHMGDFDGRSSFATWLTRIAINSALMTLRKRRGRQYVSLDRHADPEAPTTSLDVVDHSPHPEQQYLVRERERKLRQAVGALRPSLRRVVEIQQLEEHSMKETARLMGLSVCATKGRLFHAKAALRRSYKLKFLSIDRARTTSTPVAKNRKPNSANRTRYSTKFFLENEALSA
jgi:RNA polymerase sigma-70 factor (ECF subfamily)